MIKNLRMTQVKSMKPKLSIMRQYCIFLFCLLIMVICACTQLPEQKPIETEPILKPDTAGDEEKINTPKIPLFEILFLEARKFAAQKDFQNALFVYNQAFFQADEIQKNELIPVIEALLTQTPSQDIEQFSLRPNIVFPQGLLQYWLGWRLVLEDDNFKAKQAIETFLLQYPHHQYFNEASDLLEIIKKSLFKRDTIGCLLPLSGKYAIFGEQALAGIQLAVKELSKQYNQEFKIIIEDTGADPIKAVEGVDRLYQKNVAAIIGPLLPVMEAGSKAQALGIPMIALTQKEEFSMHGDYLFSNFITPRMQVQTLGSYLFGELGLKKIGILYPKETYGQKYMDLFWDVADEYNAQVVGVESYDGKGTDFTQALQKLTGAFYSLPEFLKQDDDDDEVVEDNELFKDDEDAQQVKEKINARNDHKDEEKITIDFQALFIPDSPSKIKLILPQLAFNDIKNVYLVGTNLWHHESLLSNDIGRYTKNAIITDGFFDQSMNPATLDFTRKFEILFDRKPQFLEAIAHDTATILFLTAMDESINSWDTLKTALQGGRVYDGATGITLFDSGGNAHRRLFLVTIKKNKFVEINH
ncbi:MAG: penicillin-binding protein activator [Pseudomonadota bacterium]